MSAVFITGAQSNTGYGIAELFAKNGWDVFITSRNGSEAEKAAKALSDTYGVFSKGYECNIGSEQQVIDIFSDIDKCGKFVEAIVLNAANMGYGSDPAKGLDFFTQDVDEFRKVFETNLVWNFTMIRQAAIRMKEHHKGSVVFLSSNTAYRAIPNRAAYSASKGGINALSKALALDLGRYGIRCNVVLPGTIKTERWYQMGSKQIVNGTLTPIGDISDYEDVANAVWYFATDMSKNTTGTELIVDGGMSCQLYPELLTELKRKQMEEV
ncbi:MAG: SDR family oxidoreductase [Acutalibacteraceae bacterium]|nr:SDR family oxidoreductase [Acutalibacteraceae bacterium]